MCGQPCQCSVAVAWGAALRSLPSTYGTTTVPVTSTAAPAPAENALSRSPPRGLVRSAGLSRIGTNIGASKPSASGPARSASAIAEIPSSRSVPVRPVAPTIAQPMLFPGTSYVDYGDVHALPRSAFSQTRISRRPNRTLRWLCRIRPSGLRRLPVDPVSA